MQKISQIDRSNVMGQEYNVTDVPKSGFNLTYNSHPAGLVIGRLYPNAYQHIMPADKFSGRNEYSLIAEPLSTPVVSDVNVSQHNFFVTYRSIDSGFEDLLTPTKLNGMSSTLSVPSFSLYDVTSLIFDIFKDYLPEFSRSTTSDPWVLNSAPDVSLYSVNNMRSVIASLLTLAKNLYIDDAYEDLFKQLEVYLKVISDKSATNSVTLADYKNLWYCIFDFFCGEGSMMDYLGYPIMKHNDVSELFDTWIKSAANQWKSSSSTGDLLLSDLALSLSSDWIAIISSFATVWPQTTDIQVIDKRSVSEYAIRAMYAIWFEYYRVNELEPRSAYLPEYHKWGSTPLISTMQNGFLNLLILRTRSWTKDPFTTAQIDDISRHVYAPIITTSSAPTNTYAVPSAPAQTNVSTSPSSATGNLWSTTSVRYVDSDGVTRVVSCPIPEALSKLDINLSESYNPGFTSTLDLFTLKKAKMLENYLKRNLCFGDEYRDRMKAHYDVEIADYRINRPEYLSGSVNEMSVKQEVANSGTIKQGFDDPSNAQYVKQGDRLMTATAGSGDTSDGFEFFATEFGIYISLLSIIPRAQYDFTCPQHFMLKTADFPTPEFAAQQEDIMNSAEIYRLGFVRPLVDNKPFGHVPYAHPYRYRVDEVHGQTLSSKFDYTFCRFYKGLTSDGTPKLNYQFIHCRPNIPMFVNQILLDGQFYGSCKHHFLVERELPQPVETI